MMGGADTGWPAMDTYYELVVEAGHKPVKSVRELFMTQTDLRTAHGRLSAALRPAYIRRK